MSIFRPTKVLAVSTLAAVGPTIGAGVASAHVSVNPDTAVAGSYPTLTFHVPNESAKASTVKVTINFPLDHPLASVSVRKQAGWTATTTTRKLTTPISDDDNATITQAVISITRTADSAGSIALGQFAQFDVSVGPVPKAASMAFAAVQTYSDGTVVKWDEPMPASGVEPEHAAPVLTIFADRPLTAGTGSTAQVTAAMPVAAAPTSTDDSTARALGIAGIPVGAVGLLVAAMAVRRGREVRS